jgi:histidinol-phosphate aminotransferase
VDYPMAVSVLPDVADATEFPLPWNGKDRSRYVRLDLSEALVTPPDNVVEALSSLAASTGFTSYPNETAFYSSLSQYTAVPERNLLLTNGSDHAIQIVMRAFVGSGDSVLTSAPTFPMYAHIATTLGAEAKEVPLTTDMEFDVDAYLENVSDRVRLLVIVNPNNPTGTRVQLDDIEKILQAHPNRPVLVDEAYFEYSGETASGLLPDYANLIILRSFSKAFGLAGLRLGYVISHSDIVSELKKLRQPFDVNSFALVAAAEHLKNPAHMHHYVEEVMERSKPLVESSLRAKGICVFPSSGNFLLARMKHRDRIVKGLREQGVLVAPQRHPMIADSMRIGIGPIKIMTDFMAMLDRMIGDECNPPRAT